MPSEFKSFAGYHTMTPLYQGENSLVFRARRVTDARPVILKMLRETYPSPERIAWFKREYEVARNLKLPGVPEVYGLYSEEGRWMMSMEDFGGDSLKLLGIAGQLPLADFLRYAIAITEIVGQIHRQHIIHKDLNPSNIVLNLTTEQIKIIDFGISTVLSQEKQSFRSPNMLEGTLAYIAPEQTGRMNRDIDYRTDFYSLGVTFYELLTGQLPFQGDDSLELIHCHIAKQPVSPCDLSSVLPLLTGEGGKWVRFLSAIILKLLAKNAEDRYQSVYGLQKDLEWCLEVISNPVLGKNRVANDFEPGQHDVSDRFSIPQKLYGREQEIQTLLHTFDLAANGAKRLMLVTGQAGVGKSALVHEIHKPITAKRGYFIAGKFDQFQRNIPYSALTQAFNQFCDYLLTESQAELTAWQRNILDAVGNNGQVLIDVIPHLERVIGKQPDVPLVGQQETQNRFNLYVQYFLRAISQPEHPLVLFIDDLQWADFASITLLNLLLTDDQCRYLLIIGAYRDNEVPAGHPLLLTLTEFEKTGLTIARIQVENLKPQDVEALAADSLGKRILTGEQTLAELVFAKTYGNAFFVHQFLQALYDEQLLTFDVQQRHWTYDIDQIQSKGATDNVVDFMARKIRRLPPETQDVLKLAACVGNKFDVHTLMKLHAGSDAATVQHVLDSAAEGLITPLDPRYKLLTVSEERIIAAGEFRFIHDRIQQAAYSLIADDRKHALHLQIGRLLLQDVPPDELEEHLFDIVEQLNLGRELVEHEAERLDLARLNLLAGKKAKTAAAYAPAVGYLRTGLTLLPDAHWQREYALTLNLHVEAIEAAYLNAEFDEMARLSDIVLEQADSLLDKVKVYEINIQACQAQGKPLEAVQTALAILQMLDVHFPARPDESGFMRGLEETRALLAEQRIEDFINLPPMTDPATLAILRIIASVAAPVYFVAPELFPLLAFTEVRLSVTYGNAPMSIIGYAMYGVILCTIGDIETGYQFGMLALRLLEIFRAHGLKAIVSVVMYHLIFHWKQHARKVLKPLFEAHQSGLETGDMIYAVDSAHGYCYNSYLVGRELPNVARDMAAYTEVIQRLNQKSAPHFYYLQIYRQAVLNLLKQSGTPYVLCGDAYNEEEMVPLHLERKDRTALCVVYFNKLLLAYLFGEYRLAAEFAGLTETYLDGATGLIHIPIFHFYDSLTRLALITGSDQDADQKHLQKVAANQEKMKTWARHAPMNHLHKFYLVEAERARVTGKDGDAREYYDQAIALAKEHEYIQEEALACELAGVFYLTKSLPELAQVYVRKAHYAYQLWGAATKVQEVEQRYAELLPPPAKTAMERTIVKKQTSTETDATSAELDVASIIKASQAISGEIVLRQLLHTLMAVMLENAAAQRGFLALVEHDRLVIEAQAEVGGEAAQVLHALPLEQAGDRVSAAIMHYVVRTRESVVLDEATAQGAFTSDPYITAHQPKSVLCLPVLGHGQCRGALYLENNLSTYGFPPERVRVLSILATQAAIAIENARIYADLEQRVHARTVELAKANKKLQESEELFSTFMEYLPAPVFIKDEDGRTVYVNRSFEEYFGAGWIDKTVFDKLPEALARIMFDDDQLAMKLGVQHRNEIVPRTNGEERIFHTTKFRIERAGESPRIGGFGLDITTLKRTEAELKQAKEAAETANRAKSDFLASMSHELRTPLNGILGYAQILKRESGFTQRQQDGLQVIEQSGQHLLSLINDILDLAKIESGKIDLYEADFHFPLFLKSVRELIQLKAKQKNLTFRAIFAEDLPTYVHGDERRLRQVLLNLLGNAVKFTEQGSVTFQVRSQACESSAFARQSRALTLRFDVEDTGIGIAPEELAAVFEPFQQAGERKYRAQGTGLGLTISRSLVELMGGTLHVKSQVGLGSAFWFELLFPEVYNSIAVFSEHQRQICGVKGRPPKILIADDQAENRAVLAGLLAPLGCEIIEALHGKDGLIKAQTSHPDVIIVDLLMPEMDGIELIRQIRRSPDLNQTIILATSASVYDDDQHQSLAAGSNAFLPKPVEAEVLFEHLQRLPNIEWQYRPSPEEESSTQAHESKEFVLPPADILETLYEYTMIGDVRALQEHLHTLAQTDVRYSAFVEHFQRLVHEFKFNEMTELLLKGLTT